ncbi:hypothetical protein F4805DRAFT_166226 [Annulohypoxylon moriforme]|nr:hypothetical protein F4805DRAFT_166226 [Annulohypoxylon moriforme]
MSRPFRADKGKGPMVLSRIPNLDGGHLHHDRESWEVARVEKGMKEHFGFVTAWEYEKMAGRGADCLAFLVKRKRRLPLELRHRRYIIKRAISDHGDSSLRIEGTWLQRLQGSAHIGAMIRFRDDDEIPKASRIETGLPFAKVLFGKNGNVRRAIRRLINPFNLDDELELDELAPYPLIVLEYLEHGTFARLISRLSHYNTTVPNRLLWSFFLCLVRACVALAYPPMLAKGRPTELETIPADGREQSQLVHGFLHTGNVMIGRGDGRFSEHTFGPTVKMIDLGGSAEATNGLGSRYNLWDISGLMMCIITKSEAWAANPSSEYRGIVTSAGPIVGRFANNHPLLDDDLRDLLARCLAENVAHRPSLRDLLTQVEHAVRTKTAQSFPLHIRPHETDAAINEFLQSCVYDAEVEAQAPNRPDIANEHLPEVTETHTGVLNPRVEFPPVRQGDWRGREDESY